MRPRIDAERLWRRVEAFAALTDTERPYTRRSFSELHLRGRARLRREFEQAGLKTRIDAGGNLIGRLEGSRPGLPAIVTGSHSDTVDGGGRFDGIAGLLAALEAAQALAENNLKLRHPLEVIDFLAEEPSQYGLSCIGSRALAGELPVEALAWRAPDGSTLAQGVQRMGGDPARLSQALRAPGEIAGFFELHIEQGPRLESSGADIGIVSSILGLTRMQLVFTGQADHAGTTPMELRRDALLGAAETLLQAYELALSRPPEAPYLIANTGALAIEPNNPNVVPGRAELLLETRSSLEQESFLFLDEVRSFAGRAAGQRGLDFSSKIMSHAPPAACSARVQDAIREACEGLDLKYLEMASGAGHDARYMTYLGPAGMLFVPCRAGRSHCPEEWVDKEQLAAGTAGLLAALIIYDEKEEARDEKPG